MKLHRTTKTLVSLALLTALPATVSAQDPPAPAGPTSPPGGDTPVFVPGPSTTTTTTTTPDRGPAPDAHLPSSSRGSTDSSKSSDGFDLKRDSAGSTPIKGGAGGQYIGEGGGVPQAHTVRRGDTLWGISGQYFKNPYQWPRLWSQNPQILNPHWIYPGDRLRMRADQVGGLLRSIPESTIFLRNYGWVDDPDKDSWGELVGAPDDHMMLSYGDDVYIEIDERKHKNLRLELGQELQIFREVRTLRGREADNTAGELVQVLGTARIDRYNPKTRMIRAHITEALDVIERGVRVGPVPRKFVIVSPVRNEKYLEARILTALYPHQFFGQSQVVFLDRGEKQGVKVGNRFIAVRRGDRWVETLDTAGQGAKIRAMTEDDRDGQAEDLRIDGPSEKYPNETYGEVRVLDVRDNTCMAIVTESTFELERDTILVMKKGY